MPRDTEPRQTTGEKRINKKELANEIKKKTKMNWGGVYEFLSSVQDGTENGLKIIIWDGAWLKSPAYSFNIKLSPEAAVLLKSIQNA